ncbi:hypothetical protein [Neptuniibacter sp. QD48_11]|uniref:hypothetical protein n=1 Tax=Neptuniibacter sp. QD48_11 TaxID=3398211 RepID=UPI0039F499FD
MHRQETVLVASDMERAMIVGDTVPKRKDSLALLVMEQLKKQGIDVNLVRNRTNSEGHKDQVVLESELGLIHVVASNCVDPNGTFATGPYIEESQTYLVDKDYVAYGWNTKDKRTFVMFVDPADVKGKESLSKSEIRDLRNKDLSFVVK